MILVWSSDANGFHDAVETGRNDSDVRVQVDGELCLLSPIVNGVSFSTNPFYIKDLVTLDRSSVCVVKQKYRGNN